MHNFESVFISFTNYPLFNWSKAIVFYVRRAVFVIIVVSLLYSLYVIAIL